MSLTLALNRLQIWLLVHDLHRSPCFKRRISARSGCRGSISSGVTPSSQSFRFQRHGLVRLRCTERVSKGGIPHHEKDWTVLLRANQYMASEGPLSRLVRCCTTKTRGVTGTRVRIVTSTFLVSDPTDSLCRSSNLGTVLLC